MCTHRTKKKIIILYTIIGINHNIYGVSEIQSLLNINKKIDRKIEIFFQHQLTNLQLILI